MHVFHEDLTLHALACRRSTPGLKFSIQVMELEQAEKYSRTVFDTTNIWSHKDFPLVPVGKMMLNKNIKMQYLSDSEVPEILSWIPCQQLFVKIE